MAHAIHVSTAYAEELGSSDGMLATLRRRDRRTPDHVALYNDLADSFADVVSHHSDCVFDRTASEAYATAFTLAWRDRPLG